MEQMPIVVALVGLGLASMRAIQLFRMGIDPEVLGAVLEKTLRLRDLARSRKLCASLGASPLGPATGALIASREFSRGTTADEATATLRDAFITAFEESAASIAAWRFVSWLALLLLVGPLVYGHFNGVLSVRLIAVSILGISILAWTARAAFRIFESGPRVLDRLLPHALPLVFEGLPSYRSPELDGIEPEPPMLSPDALAFAIERDGVAEGSETFVEPIIKIGRAATAQLKLDDATVARMHAVIERTDDGVVIIDLGSDAGTHVNGERANKARLAHGDVVTIGPFRLTVALGAVRSRG